MRTAIQELIEWTNQYKGQMISADQVVLQAHKLLEKEKEQIIDAYVKGFDISAEGWNGEYGIKDFNNIKEEIKAEEYYNQTYNQKQHIIDIMKADEDDGLYNQNES
jgi:hypothetical protein